jgi:hypothetical protein
LRNALDGIIDASATNPYLLKIEPGIYDLEFLLVMKDYVDLEGSGEGVTVLTSGGNVTIQTNTTQELRFLTIRNTGIGSYTAALTAVTNAVLSLRHVTLESTNSVEVVGMDIFQAFADISDVRISVSEGQTVRGIGVFSVGASPLLQNVQISVSGGASATSAYHGEMISARNLLISATSASGTVRGIHLVAPTQPLPQVIRDSTIKVSLTGAGEAFGVDSASPTQLHGSSVLAESAGASGSNCFGFISRAEALPSEITSSQVGAAGCINNQGVRSQGPALRVTNSTVTGAAYTAVGTDTMFVGATRMVGGPVLGLSTSPRCGFVFDEADAVYTNTCPP